MTLQSMLAIAGLAMCTVVVVSIAVFRVERLKWVISLVIISSFAIGTQHSVATNPFKLAWLCNVTACLAIFLCFRFHQRVYDVFTYFAWTGDLFTLLGWDNPLCPPLAEHPVAWAAFWLKHIGPLSLSLYLILAMRKRVTATAFRFSLTLMLLYACAMYPYNVIFEQNILDLMWPTIPADQAFGPWPIYVFVNVSLALSWYVALHGCLKRLGIVDGQRAQMLEPAIMMPAQTVSRPPGI